MALWIDLTDFLQWSGNLTGIQRIQYNLSKKYIESGREVHFFVYYESERTFKQVEFNPDNIVKHGIVNGGDDVSLVAESKYIAKIKDFKNKFLKGSDPKQRDISTLESPFDDGDIILIMGGIWVGSFIDDLKLHKDRYQLKLVHFAFDMIPTLFPGYVVDWLPTAFKSYQQKVFTMAEGIVAISESTKRDVLSFIENNDIKNNPRIEVVRIGEDIRSDKDYKDIVPSKPIQALKEQDFILSVSTFEVRKNHAALFYVLKEAKNRGITLPRIVIVGRSGWLTDDIRYIMHNDFDASSSITILNDVDDRDLDWLYKKCRFTIFPSFYEGWGMPVAESLSYGKMCLASNTSSIPEIAGDLIEYFSPYDTGSILNKIDKYMDDDVLASKTEQIKTFYRRTEWQDMYVKVAAFVDKVNLS